MDAPEFACDECGWVGKTPNTLDMSKEDLKELFGDAEAAIPACPNCGSLVDKL